MKKLSIILIIAMVFCAVLAIVPASAEVETTADLKVDTNVFKGDYIAGDDNPVDSVIVWVDVKENKFKASKEYGTFIYQSCDDSKIDLTKGSFNPAESGKATFATRFDLTKFVKGVEYAVKGYVKDGETIELSRTTAFFNVNDANFKNFDIVIHGPNITYTSQESATNFGGRQDNTQYFVYRDDVLLGATNELKFNVVDELFDEDDNFEEIAHTVTVKSISGLNVGGQSNAYSFEMQVISDADSFLESVGSENDADQSAQDRYQVLTEDIVLDGLRLKSWSITDGNWKTTHKLNSVIKYYADTLDGRGHKLTVKVDAEDLTEGAQFGGLFGKFCETGFLRNLNYEMIATHNVEQSNMKGAEGARACGLTMIGWGSFENCYLKATLASLKHPVGASTCWRRDTFIGFPGNYTATNVIAELTVLDAGGNFFGDMPNHQGTGNIGTGFSWESQHTPTANNFVMVSPVTMFEGRASIGFVKGSNVNYCNSYANLLSGENCLIAEGSDPVAENVGGYRSEYLYDNNLLNIQWDENIWEFNREEGYIKFFDRFIYTAPTPQD